MAVWNEYSVSVADGIIRSLHCFNTAFNWFRELKLNYCTLLCTQCKSPDDQINHIHDRNEVGGELTTAENIVLDMITTLGARSRTKNH